MLRGDRALIGIALIQVDESFVDVTVYPLIQCYKFGCLRGGGGSGGGRRHIVWQWVVSCRVWIGFWRWRRVPSGRRWDLRRHHFTPYNTRALTVARVVHCRLYVPGHP